MGDEQDKSSRAGSKLVRATQAASPFGTAIRLLARRPYSVAELRRALLRKFGEEPAIQEAVARLRQLGFLDDRRFALQYASFLVRHRALGPERIRRELQLKHVNEPAIDAALSHAFEEIPEEQLLERALAKKLRSIRLPLTVPRFYSLCQGLRRLGFRSDAIMKAMHSRPELRPIAEGRILNDEL